MSNDDDPKTESESDLSPEIVAQLRKQCQADISIPNAIEQAVLADARQVLLVRPQKPTGWRQWTIGLVSVGSLAAALLIFVWPQIGDPGAGEGMEMSASPAAMHDSEESADAGLPAESVAAFLKEDIDQDGRVDILDAFALARQLEDPRSTPANGDQDGNGVFDQDDVKFVALTAVML